MRNYKVCTWVAAASAACALALSGCQEECRTGESECISNALIQTCVPTDDGNEWLVHQCSTNEHCVDKMQPHRDGGADDDSGAADGGSDAGSTTPEAIPGTGAACVGTCEIGDHDCVSPTLARVCIAGGVWQLSACDVGQTCDKKTGACIVSSGKDTVKLCKPGAKACASDKVEKVCDADGTGWVTQQCAANETCAKDECAPDPKSSCDDANACIDNKTAVRCLGVDKGFETVKCEGDLYCESGRCRGAVCALGSLCTTNNQVRECVDGKSYKDSQCGVNEVCQQLKDNARCVPMQCTVGTSACGDPRDPMVDPKKHFTTCAVAAGGSGVPEWVSGECTGNTTCNPALAATPNPCSQSCTKGAQRCSSDSVSGVNDGFQTCGDDGKWGPIQTCNTENQSQKQCVLAPNPNASVLPKALCAEPVCFWAFSNTSSQAQGACDGEQLQKCASDGTLQEPMPCAQGICHTVNMSAPTTADGRVPGTCDPTPQCEEGEEICLPAGNTATPRYRSCVNGFFSVEVKTCENDGACFNTRDDKGKRRKVCGAECSPGSGRCNGDGELEKCSADGSWGRGVQCDRGACRSLGNNDASCVLDCVPGSTSCTGANVTAPDGYHSGKAEQRQCQPDGTWGAPTACPNNRACRVSGSGISLGCVACVGPKAPGGNAESSVDSRCDANDPAKIQDCGDNNNWLSSRTCSDGKQCVAPVSQSCGTCTGVNNTTFQCTDSNLRTEQVCASCDVPIMGGGTTTIAACTQAAIAATVNTTVTTCAGVTNGGSPGNWAGQSDCCSGYHKTAQQTSNASCTSRGFGAPVSWGGVSDCCTASRLGTAGAPFAYCD